MLSNSSLMASIDEKIPSKQRVIEADEAAPPVLVRRPIAAVAPRRIQMLVLVAIRDHDPPEHIGHHLAESALRDQRRSLLLEFGPIIFLQKLLVRLVQSRPHL